MPARMTIAMLLALSALTACALEEGNYVNEASAISSTRRILTSQITYSATVGKGNYAVDLEPLRDAALIDALLASGTKDGYALSTSGDTSTFTVNARPLTYGSTGTRSFFCDETGVIRYTREDRPATVEDTLLGE